MLQMKSYSQDLVDFIHDGVKMRFGKVAFLMASSPGLSIQLSLERMK